MFQYLETKYPENTAKEVVGDIQVSWTAQKLQILQIYSSGLEYSLLSPKNEQCHQMTYCRDFLGDVARASLNQTPANIYGFVYDPRKQPAVDFESIRLVIFNKSDSDFANKIPGILDVLNQVEAHLDLRLTVAHKVVNPQDGVDSFVLIGSKRWLEAPPMLSLFTLLIRTGCSHSVGSKVIETINALIKGDKPEYQHYDKKHWEEALPAFDLINKIGYRPLFFMDIKKNYPEKVDISTFHHYTGISALGKKEVPDNVKYWMSKKLTEKPSLEQRRAAKAEAAKTAVVEETAVV